MKRLGQHFLISKEEIKKVVEALDLKPGETVIEIGPGHGELTNKIIEKLKDLKIERFKIIAIEKDEKLVEFLQQKFASDKNIEIIQGDALKILPKLCFKLHASGFKIIGNIPYYITGYLFRILSELENKPSLIVLTIQKEMAQRIVSQPPQMNLLAASVQFWAEPKIVSYISKKEFKPAPKVDSAIIKLIPKPYTLNPKPYYNFIKILFKQPRKTILNNLIHADSHGLEHGLTRINKKEKTIENLQKIGVNPTDRPQNLSINQLIELAKSF